jgi:hypothetical protein
LGQVAESAVQQPAGATAGAGGHVLLLDQSGPQTPQSRIPRDASPNDPAANDQHIQCLAAQGVGLQGTQLGEVQIHDRRAHLVSVYGTKEDNTTKGTKDTKENQARTES